MTSLLAAVGFLTALPVPASAGSPAQLSFARAHFPLVGLCLGVALAGLDAGLRRILPIPLTSAVLIAALFLLTRGLHLDGLMDTVDGVLGGHTRERRLAIMRDTHVGAFGVGAALCVVLLKWVALLSLAAPARFWVLAVFPALSRWAMVLALSTFPYVRSEGLGTPFQRGRPFLGASVAASVSLVASFLLAGWGGLVLLAAASGTALLLGMLLTHLLGGLTGDTYGAINEVTETLVLVVAVGLAPLDWLRPIAQLL